MSENFKMSETSIDSSRPIESKSHRFRLALVPNLHIEDVWPQAISHFMNGEEHWKQFYSLPQLKKNFLLGLQQLWVVIEDESKICCVIVTQLDEFPEKKVLRIGYIGGSGLWPGLLRELEKIENWAIGKGAVLVDILGRKEWKKLLAGYEYTVPGVVYRKELKR